MMLAEVKYKKTVIDWLSEIPQHWKVVRLKFLDDVIMGQSPNSSSYNDEKKGYAFLQGNAEFGEIYPIQRLYTTEPRKIAPAGSILYSVRAPIGAVNKADKDYCIGRGLCSIIPVKTNADFLYYVSLLAKQELNSLGTGSTFTAISVADVSNIRIPVPPLNEQELIASYLNTVSAKISYFIQSKRRFIELLKEQRQSIIDEILNPEQSGWKYLRLKNVVTVNDETIGEETDDNFILKYIDIGNVNSLGQIESLQEMYFNKCPIKSKTNCPKR